jgi:anti-sigma factor ChrR (cupin superfamily)
MKMRIIRLREHPNDEMLLAYLDGELPNGQMSAIRAHLLVCWQCRSSLSDLETLAETISQLLSTSSKIDFDRSVRAKEKFLRWRAAFESSRRSFFSCQVPQLLRNLADAVLA